ncbi:uncharacterized protein LOC127875369 [Dreissena polymorpha]|uniref:Uncharacterized protein n=1 Tax=Dreissena polymorpha TaxID=45954 RepID=A0A9D4L8V8_DREPO|nr:uncharacterized protein LOC127875369 [Dreissena polymorpha]KAH3853746.1 hypothetical protein DPMN_096278 [Dreissena polymorpha]
MDANTLQCILRSKYNIDEKLQADGIFVALLGGTVEAIGLYGIGIGERCVVVAGINLRGPHIDYDLVSLTPIGVLDVKYKNASRIITISSQFKARQAFQLCSNEKAAAIWDDFTTAIDCLSSKSGGDIWCSASLSISSSSDASMDIEYERNYQRHFTGGTIRNYRCVPPQRLPTADESFRSISLPDMACGPTDAKHALWRQHVKRGHSLDCVDVSFDSFINGDVTNRNAIFEQVDLTAHAAVIGEISGQLTNERRVDLSRKPSSLAERFRRFFTCCRSKR